MNDVEVRRLFSSRVRSWLAGNGMTRYALASRMGVPWNTIHSWASGRSVPGYIRLRELSIATGKPADWWLGLDEEVDGGRDGR